MPKFGLEINQKTGSFWSKSVNHRRRTRCPVSNKKTGFGAFRKRLSGFKKGLNQVNALGSGIIGDAVFLVALGIVFRFYGFLRNRFLA